LLSLFNAPLAVFRRRRLRHFRLNRCRQRHATLRHCRLRFSPAPPIYAARRLPHSHFAACFTPLIFAIACRFRLPFHLRFRRCQRQLPPFRLALRCRCCAELLPPLLRFRRLLFFTLALRLIARRCRRCQDAAAAS